MKREEKLKSLIINTFTFQSENVTDEHLENRVRYMPKKLYKYKKIDKFCFDQIEKQYAWFSKFSEVDDQLEYTINYDSKTFQKELGEALDENIEYLLQERMEKNYNIKMDVNIIRKIKNEYMRTSEENIDLKIKLCEQDQESKGKTDLVNIVFLELYYFFLRRRDYIILLENILIKELKDKREKSKVFCLSADYNNDAMWSLYAAEHEGFCIEYSIKNVFEHNFNDSYIFNYLWPVIYKKNKHFNMFEFLRPTIQNIFKNSTTEVLNKNQQILLNQNLFTKSYSWRWQNEWRFFLNEVDNKVDFPFISAIYIGNKMSEDNKKRILDISKKNKYNVYQQKINRIGSDYEYELIYEP
ncbi:DUF2971 domain-containing protein [Thomasclavelia cocleata]|uniref:DUF2971 domain-containing protein n=1 Tax=Thomasclavelia cocleata TaxID=69824 RepID=UPI00258ACF00|nr:DUF2971 domain-containing protein [Thomasclavelia cocleata]